jgi:hypothetical protein
MPGKVLDVRELECAVEAVLDVLNRFADVPA